MDVVLLLLALDSTYVGPHKIVATTRQAYDEQIDERDRLDWLTTLIECPSVHIRWSSLGPFGLVIQSAARLASAPREP